MPPRPADPEIRSSLLAAASGLFLSKGFAATGIGDICDTAGYTKGALFHHWSSKNDLAVEVLDRWTKAGFEAFSKAPFLRSTTAVDRALGYVDFTAELSKRAPIGCLIGTLAQEISESHPELRARCLGAFREWGNGFAAMLDEAQREIGRPRGFDSASVASHFIAVFEGAQLLAKARQSKALVEEHLAHFRAYLACLLSLQAARGGVRARASRSGRSRGSMGRRRK